MDDTIAQPKVGTMIVLPSGDFLTAAEALNWIAFQRAEDVDLIGKNALWREFGFEPALPPQVGGWDYVVAEAAGMLEPEHHALMRYWQSIRGREPKNLQSARDSAARYREARGWSALDLHCYSTSRKELYAQRLDRLTLAQNDLRNALAAERLTTWATRNVTADVSRTSKLIGMASAVPWQFFLTPGATVQLSGTVTSDSDVRYQEARFRSAEITALWPLPEVLQSTPSDCNSPDMSSSPAITWMLSHVTAAERGKWKMEGAITQCRADTGSTYRAAKSAWKGLPESIRGKPGAHK